MVSAIDNVDKARNKQTRQTFHCLYPPGHMQSHTQITIVQTSPHTGKQSVNQKDVMVGFPVSKRLKGSVH